MKKLHFFPLIAIASLFQFPSCHKDNGVDNNYHISFTVDGVARKYSLYTFAHLDTLSGYIELSAGGTDSPTSLDNSMAFYVNNYPGNTAITTGEYADNSVNFEVLSTYTENGEEYEAGQSIAEEAVNQNFVIPHHFKIIITAIDKSSVRGTFSGDHFKFGTLATTPKRSIANGEFHLKLL